MGLCIIAGRVNPADKSKEYETYGHKTHRPKAVATDESYDIEHSMENVEELETAFSISYGSYHGLKREILDGINNYNKVQTDPFNMQSNTEFDTVMNFSDCEGVIGNKACKRLAALFTADLVKSVANFIRDSWTNPDDGEVDEFYVNCFLGFIKATYAAASHDDGVLIYC